MISTADLMHNINTRQNTKLNPMTSKLAADFETTLRKQEKNENIVIIWALD